MTARVRSWHRWSLSYGALPSDYRNTDSDALNIFGGRAGILMSASRWEGWSFSLGLAGVGFVGLHRNPPPDPPLDMYRRMRVAEALSCAYRNGYDEGHRAGVSWVLFWYAVAWLAILVGRIIW